MLVFRYINLLKSRYIAKILSVGLAVAVLCSVMAIPAFAETEYVEIVITVEDIYNMAQSGDFTINYELKNTSNSSAYINFYVPGNVKSYTYGSSSNLSFTVNQYSSLLNQDVCLFYSPVAFSPSSMGNNPNWNIYYSIVMPFGYFLRGSEFYFSAYFGDDVTTSNLGSLELYDSDGTLMDTITDTYFAITPSVFSSDPYLISLYSQGAWSDNLGSRKTNHLSYKFSPSTSYSVGSMRFSSSISWSDSAYTSEYIVVPAFMISSITADVPKESSGVIEEYLDVIAGSPSPENQQKINDLKQQMQDIDDQLKQDASDMQVEIPDISDVEATIPEELTQGNEIVSEQVLSPILNAQPISTIFLGLFAIVSLKLFLFGSGPH